MKTGTCHFPSYGAALRYYRPYCGEPESDAPNPAAHRMERRRSYIARSSKDDECRRMVDAKLNSAEIHIGRPDLKPGETLTIEDNRYHINS